MPREEWPVTRDFKNKIPEEEVVQTIKAPKVKLNLLRLVPTCSCRVCSWLKDSYQYSDCKKAFNPQESSCFQSFITYQSRRIALKGHEALLLESFKQVRPSRIGYLRDQAGTRTTLNKRWKLSLSHHFWLKTIKVLTILCYFSCNYR